MNHDSLRQAQRDRAGGGPGRLRWGAGAHGGCHGAGAGAAPWMWMDGIVFVEKKHYHLVI